MKKYSFLILLLSALFLIPNGCREREIIIQETNIYFYENFDGYATGGYPRGDWKTEEYGTSHIAINSDFRYGSSGKSCGFFDPDPDTSCWCHIETSIEKHTTGTIEFVWRYESSNDVFGFRTREGEEFDWSRVAFEILFQDNEIQVLNTDQATFTTICSVRPRRWYEMKITFDCSEKTYSVYMDDDFKASDLPFCGEDATYFDMIEFIAFAYPYAGSPEPRTCQAAYVDEVKLWTFEENPVTYSLYGKRELKFQKSSRTVFRNVRMKQGCAKN